MATTDTTSLATNDRSGRNDAALVGRACEAHDLKQILNTIADQIADADKRHSEQLSLMQQRLTVLGAEAKVMRETAPAELAPTLDRIEDRMALLSTKMLDNEPERKSAHVEGFSAPVSVPASSEPPAALRSALSVDELGSFTRREDSMRADGSSKVDRFDMVNLDGSFMDDEPWDETSAEALTRLYEGGNAGLTLIDSQATTPDASAPMSLVGPDMLDVASHLAPSTAAIEAAIRNEPFSNGAPILTLVPPPNSDAGTNSVAKTQRSSNTAIDEERLWLEQRFADVAAKLEMSVASMRPDGSVTELTSRFASLEERLGAVMGQGPTHADLSSLQSIESQVEDLTARLDSVQTHFSRLDTIELELRGLADQINEDNLTRLFQRSSPRNAEADAAAGRVAQRIPHIENALQAIGDQLSEERLSALIGGGHAGQQDVAAMAALVATQLAEQMSKDHGGSAESVERIDDLRSMLTGFIEEQRHGDEQTNTMLDTMQQAMIRLLDRMDSIETGIPAHHAEPGSQLSSVGASVPMHPLYEDDALPPPLDRRNGGLVGAATLGDAPSSQNAPLLPDRPSLMAPSRDIEYGSANGGQHYGDAKQDAVSAEVALSNGLSADRGGPRPAAVEPASLQREDFIAAARRAARQAAQAPQEPVEAESLAAPRANVRSLAAASARGATSAGKVNGASTKGGARQPSMLTIGLVSLITVGVTFMLAKPYLIAATRQAEPVTLEQAPALSGAVTPRVGNGASSVPNKGGAPNLTESDDIIDMTPTPPRRSSNMGPTTVGEAISATDATVAVALPSESNPGRAGAGSSGRIEEGNSGVKGIVEMPPLAIGPNSLRVAAAKGDPSAEFEVGARFAEGKGVQQDLKQAVSWYQRAASQGFAPAQYRLASMLERGLGVKTDLAKATIWYQRAAELGNVKAMHNLAVLSAGREGSVADYPAAIRWFTTAAEHGLTDSQFNLAIMYETGLGIDKDAKTAFKWFSLAARAGDPEASRRRDVMRAKLTPAELRDSDAEIEAWRERRADVSINDTRLAGEAWKQRLR